MIDAASRGRLAVLVRSSLGEPVAEREDETGFLIVSEAVPEVAVRLTADGVDVLFYGLRWDGPATLVDCHELMISLPWAELPESTEQAWAVVEVRIEESRRLRATSYRTCRHCGRNTPPEYMHDEQLCMGCAPGVLGVVY